MQFNGEVKSAEVVSRVGKDEDTEPGTVQVVIQLREPYDHSPGSVTLKLPYGQARAYPVGRKVTVTIEPRGKRKEKK